MLEDYQRAEIESRKMNAVANRIVRALKWAAIVLVVWGCYLFFFGTGQPLLVIVGGIFLWALGWGIRATVEFVVFDMLPKSYTENDVFHATTQLRDLDRSDPAPNFRYERFLDLFVPTENNINNKKEARYALGRNYGYVLSLYQGKPTDFDKFLQEVLRGTLASPSVARSSYQSFVKLRREANQDFFEGVRDAQARMSQNNLPA